MVMARRVAVFFSMVVIMRVPMRRSVGRRHVDDVTMPDAALGDDMVGKRLHLRAAALEHGHLQAAFMIEVHMQRRLRQVVMVVKLLGQALGQVAGVMIVNVDQRGDAVAGARRFDRGLF